MKLLLALTSVAVVAGSAAYAHAEPSSGDASFLDALTKAGITYQNADGAVASGKAVCAMLDDGKNATDIVNQLRQVNPGFSARDAAKFSVLASVAYCPKYMQAGGESGGSG
ncbi:DUF732 domain-containing protein [Mycobacterium heckeshornense]|uniref:DUF732 domain-containing protein n=1 Tax=Mycobacterium heckeshornense TaxID=110505 RepID=A0A2G8B415_9MYCO|nr:DUF732 domain-containing protein [Mycobacterium heckeshornense]KMV22383.1 hypothetical protein ACT16_11095 [Mycobacterium heckeshornense]MCV7034803.1 DUF732 domain-containing protein [Mycobacterium heckeshornense]PIJ32505.1 DUF732 domain-containing protein [Mycobacterium heckeshornense]BCO36733.1 hypothetical protein MHEC_31660 [Mycobacterium heckeshornense]